MADEEIELGCQRGEKVAKEDSSDDECWVEQYRGDSRKWLIGGDVSTKAQPEATGSVMKTSYMLRAGDFRPTIGKKKQMLLERFRKEAFEEIMVEKLAPAPVEEYCSEYDSNFQKEGFAPAENFYDGLEESFEKYPLYGPPTVNRLPCAPRKNRNLLYPFRRNTQFTKPLSEVLDENYTP